MSRRILLSFVFLAVIIGLGTGCSSVSRYRFERAYQFEKQGSTEKALSKYAALLAHIPASDHHLRSQVYFRMGECFWRLDKVNEAFAAFQAAAETDAKNVPAHLRLGEIYLAGGAAQRATEQAHTVLQLASANVDGLALLGAASSAVGDTRLAQKAFERVLESDPQRVNVAVALADIYNREDRVEDARRVLRQAAAAQPASSRPWLALGRLEEQEGDAGAAEQAYRNAVAAEDTVEANLRLAQFLQRTSRVGDAEKILAHADRLRPDLPIALSDFKFISGQPISALDRYTIALRSPPMEKKVRTGWLWSRAGKFAPETAANRASVAARVIEADLQAGGKGAGAEVPENATAAARLHLEQYRQELDPATVSTLEAEIAIAERNLTKAAVHAEGAVAQAPSSPSAHYVRGVVKYLRGETANARTDFTTSYEQDPSYVPARLALAADALRTGDSSGAEEYVISVVREEPGNVQALNLFARVLAEQRRYESAALIARRAIKLDTGNAEPHVTLGKIALAQGNIPSALGAFEQAIALEPRSEEALEGLSRVYRRGKITKPMLAKLERIAEMPPASAPLWEIAGRIYAERGWHADARRCFQRALSVDPKRATSAALLAGIQANRGDYVSALAAGSAIGGSRSAVLRAVRAEEERNVPAAIREYDLAVREGDASGIAANNLAWLLANEGKDLDRAISLALHARTLRPDSAQVLDTLGFVHLKRREYSQAVAVLKKAVLFASQKNTNLKELAAIRQHLSEAYYRSGDNAEAAALWKTTPRKPRNSARVLSAPIAVTGGK
ncbi:MAG TPA: tetratricopeptide repeat protein [Terriglobales bacterium]|nr:tetratricopeptide repeat protein [Terriglobales bacterium]